MGFHRLHLVDALEEEERVPVRKEERGEEALVADDQPVVDARLLDHDYRALVVGGVGAVHDGFEVDELVDALLRHVLGHEDVAGQVAGLGEEGQSGAVVAVRLRDESARAADGVAVSAMAGGDLVQRVGDAERLERLLAEAGSLVLDEDRGQANVRGELDEGGDCGRREESERVGQRRKGGQGAAEGAGKREERLDGALVLESAVARGIKVDSRSCWSDEDGGGEADGADPFDEEPRKEVNGVVAQDGVRGGRVRGERSF